MLIPSVNPAHSPSSIPPPTVIVGAGIIGLSTAYHLAHAVNSSIVVVDQAPAICSAASGQCEGALGEFGFTKETQPLARLSYRLFARLAADNGGATDNDGGAIDNDSAATDNNGAVIDNDDTAVDNDGTAIDNDNAATDNDGTVINTDGAVTDNDGAAIDNDSAATDNGGAAFGYSSLAVHTVFSNAYDPSNPRLPFPVEREEDISRLPSWLRVQPSWRAGLIDDGKRAARLDPPKFCNFLKQECEKLGVRFLTNSTAIRAHKTRDEAGRFSLSAVDIRSGASNAEQQIIRVPCHALVISAGSWSPGVFSSLFPTAHLRLRMAEHQLVQTWLRFSAPNGKADTEPDRCEQVWLKPLDDMVDLHVSSFADGDLYAAGALEDGDSSPPYPQFVQPTPEEIAELSSLVTDYVDLSGGRKLVQSGRAYMPCTAHGRPIMARVPWSLLFQGEDEGNKGGIYLNFGHGLDGFTLGLGSGKVMSELILGEKTSVDLSPFGLLDTSQLPAY